jgi:hypothetical protein
MNAARFVFDCLTPADLGALQACLDDCRLSRVSDDNTVDALVGCIVDNAIVGRPGDDATETQESAAVGRVYDLAYHIVHKRNRKI